MVAVVDAGERCVGVGAPRLVPQGVADLGVLDDVGPVLEDPVLAGGAGVVGVADDLVDVGEGELSAAGGVDDVAGVVRSGVQDGVEFSVAAAEFSVAAHDRPVRFVSGGGGEPGPGGRAAGREVLPLSGVGGVVGCGSEPVAGGGGVSLLPGDDVADDGVPAGGADRVGGAWSDEVVQPVGLGAGELSDTDGDGTVDGPLQDGDLVDGRSRGRSRCRSTPPTAPPARCGFAATCRRRSA